MEFYHVPSLAENKHSCNKERKLLLVHFSHSGLFFYLLFFLCLVHVYYRNFPYERFLMIPYVVSLMQSNGQNKNLEDLYVSAWKTESVDNGTKAYKDASVINLNDLISNVNIDAWNTSAYSGQITGVENLTISTVAHVALNNTGAKNSDQQGSKIKDKDFASNNTDTYGNISLEPTMLLDFYSRLKKKSCTLALRHIDKLKFMVC